MNADALSPKPMIKTLSRALLLIALPAALLPGCQSAFGPESLQRTHPAYNAAITASVNEQMLQNLVRLRYRDVPFFLEIGSVTASLSVGANADLGGSVTIGGEDSLSSLAGIAYVDSPTISYVPLRGEDLLKSLLSPLQLESILVLTQSGWRISRVFGLCFERINDLRNAPTASGPTPDQEPDYRSFNRLLESLNRLQTRGQIEVGAQGEGADAGIVVKLKADDDSSRGLDEVRALLGIESVSNAFNLNTNFLETVANQWTVRTRSLSSLLYYLSQNVDTPRAHQSAGLVTVTEARGGGVFDWGDTPAGRLFQVNSSPERPEGAYIATFYRGHWFWIEDSDLESKSTFMLLRQLFDLQAGQSTVQGPTLTLPVGR